MEKVKTKSILKSKKFNELKKIGGHKVYHLEGNAFKHSILVWKASKRLFRGDSFMQRVALLHDIGKICSSRRNGKDDWVYPNHSVMGGEILGKFIKETNPRFEEAKWYISNHIKPLFWKSILDAEKLQESAPANCQVQKLALLALCDLCGSYSTKEASEKNKPLIDLLIEVSKIKGN